MKNVLTTSASRIAKLEEQDRLPERAPRTVLLLLGLLLLGRRVGVGTDVRGGHAVTIPTGSLVTRATRVRAREPPTLLRMSESPAPLAVGFDLDMTLIDTVPGFARTLEALGAELGVEFPVEEMTARLGPPLETMLEPHLAAEAIGPAGDRFRALYPDHAIASVPVLPGAHEALAAVRAHRGRIVVVTGKYPDNARRHQDHLGLDVDVLEGWVWGVGKAEVLRREGVSVYVGDHVHDVEGALAAGVLSVSVLTGGCTREELLAAGTHVVLDSLDRVPGVARRAPAGHAAGRAGGRPAGPRLGAGRLQRWRRQRVPARRRRPRASARTGSSRRPATRTRCPRSSATRRGRSPSRSASRCSPRRPTRWSARATAPTARTAASSARPSWSRCSSGLAERARARRGRDRHQRRRRGRRLPAGHPRGRRARRRRPAARRRADQGAGARGVPPLGPADLGQARGRLPLVAGRLRRRGDAVRAGPRGAGRGRRTPRAAVRARPPGPRPRCRPGLRRGRRRPAAARRGRRRTGPRRRPRGRLRRGRGRPARASAPGR